MGDGKVIVVTSPALSTALRVLKPEVAKAGVNCCLGALLLLLLCGDVVAHRPYEKLREASLCFVIETTQHIEGHIDYLIHLVHPFIALQTTT